MRNLAEGAVTCGIVLASMAVAMCLGHFSSRSLGLPRLDLGPFLMYVLPALQWLSSRKDPQSGNDLRDGILAFSTVLFVAILCLSFVEKPAWSLGMRALVAAHAGTLSALEWCLLHFIGRMCGTRLRIG
jgi:hypothetical protein